MAWSGLDSVTDPGCAVASSTRRMGVATDHFAVDVTGFEVVA